MNDRAFDKCIKLMCDGKQEGLKKVYDAYLPYIYAVIFGILQNKEDAEDVTSEFFIRIWNTAENYRPGTGHKTYLTTIARNMAIDHWRKRKRELPRDLSGGSEEDENSLYQSPEALPEEAADQGFEEELVESMTMGEALSTLSPAEQEIIRYKFGGDMTFAEIAEVTNTPMGTVTWRYREAIKKLRRYGYE